MQVVYVQSEYDAGLANPKRDALPNVVTYNFADHGMVDTWVAQAGDSDPLTGLAILGNMSASFCESLFLHNPVSSICDIARTDGCGSWCWMPSAALMWP